MEFDQIKYQNYVRILNEELIPAMGCTEPIAIAYCGALVRKHLGNIPSKVVIKVSGNIIKNVKSVTVPNTLGLCGIDTACAVGILGGDASKLLEVIADVNEDIALSIPNYIKENDFTILHADNEHTLYIEIIGFYENDYVTQQRSSCLFAFHLLCRSFPVVSGDFFYVSDLIRVKCVPDSRERMRVDIEFVIDHSVLFVLGIDQR